MPFCDLHAGRGCPGDPHSWRPVRWGWAQPWASCPLVKWAAWGPSWCPVHCSCVRQVLCWSGGSRAVAGCPSHPSRVSVASCISSCLPASSMLFLRRRVVPKGDFFHGFICCSYFVFHIFMEWVIGSNWGYYILFIALASCILHIFCIFLLFFFFFLFWTLLESKLNKTKQQKKTTRIVYGETFHWFNVFVTYDLAWTVILPDVLHTY